MRKFISASVLAIGALALAPSAIGSVGRAFSQTAAPQPSGAGQGDQVPLSEAQVQQYIAAQADMDAAVDDAPKEATNAPNPKVLAKLNAAAKKNKFASYDDFTRVAGSVGLVMDGIDPKTKTYVGAATVLERSIADVKADSSMTPADKKEALDELNDELKNITPVKFPGNIDLVVKYYDQLAQSDTEPTK